VGRATTLEAADTALQADVAALEATDTALQGDVAALQGDVAALEGRATALEGIGAASRIETLERGVAVERGRYLEVFDDFCEVVDNKGATTPHVIGDGLWLAAFSNAADVAFGRNATQLAISRVANTASAGIFKSGASDEIGHWKMRARALVETLSTNFEIGFISTVSPSPGNASGSAFTAYFASGTSPRWILRTRNGATGLQTLWETDVVVAPNSLYRLELEHNGTDYTLKINNSPATIAGPNIPAVTDFAFPMARMSGAAGAVGRIDFIHAYSDLPRW
jgi:hypothetical protein